jgi:hypothetical protein
MPVKRTRTAAGEAIRNATKALDGAKVPVGWFAKDRYPNGGPAVAYVAAIQEFGTPKIPPRPYMRIAGEKNKEAWKNNFGKAATLILKGKLAPADGLEMIGIGISGDIRKQIASTSSPPLSKFTLMMRKMKREDQSRKVNGAFLQEAANRLAAGESTDDAPDDPLRDTTLMISTLTYQVELKK